MKCRMLGNLADWRDGGVPLFSKSVKLRQTHTNDFILYT